MNKSKKIVLSGLLLALTMILPFLTGQIPQVGKMLSPMHIPVLIAGFICGWPYAIVIGFIAPFLRFFLFQMPKIFPTGLAMSFELAAYGFLAGILYKKLRKTNANIYVTLIGAMLGGRVVWGIVMFIISMATTVKFSFKIFMTAAFINGIPGIILHIILIPVVVMALKKVGFMKDESVAELSRK
ncbi:Thiamine transporter ThiT [Hathewaya proteolytica DSM 3090]|uniref:Thiamine transporter ThiT n=1 Tax=Hathewaya proteolytica DSM 3090 TaxID=1121331 RepID=A0A1M6JPJ2_9CLOT|nr:ECF transporter S component [Hathewaya proteolytica]SHJ48590.1 Thiamine transporter ThiT [Hathewaya proteolytica DSM 3090]